MTDATAPGAAGSRRALVTSKRLSIRDLVPDDLRQVQRWHRLDDPSSRLWNIPRSVSAQPEPWRGNAPGNPSRLWFGVVRLSDGCLVGSVSGSVEALEGPQDCVREIAERYRSRRDVLCDGLNSVGWELEKPKGTMFVWAPIPEPYREMGSLEFSKLLLKEAKVAVSPGIGFGEYGDDHVRFGLIENEHRTRQAIRGIRDMFRKG